MSSVLSGEDTSEYQYLLMATRGGVIKKTAIADFANVRRNGLIAITLAPADALAWVKPTSGKDDIMFMGLWLKFASFYIDGIYLFFVLCIR